MAILEWLLFIVTWPICWVVNRLFTLNDLEQSMLPFVVIAFPFWFPVFLFNWAETKWREWFPR